MVKQEFVNQVSEAYARLYDLVYLRTQPISQILVQEEGLTRKEKAWKAHHILIEAIDELKPQAGANLQSRQERRHKLMVLRYVKAIEPQVVANELSISRRHFYREHNIAMEAIGDILWHRYAINTTPHFTQKTDSPEEVSSHLESLRMETARFTQANRYARIEKVIKDLPHLLKNVLEQRQISFDINLSEGFPVATTIDSQLLKQMLLSALSWLIERTAKTHIRLEPQTQQKNINLSLYVYPETEIRAASAEEIQDQLSTLDELASVSGASITPLWLEKMVYGFDIQLPIAQQTILVVDDNPDILELCQRYLSANHYHVVTTQAPEKTLKLVQQLQPYAVIIDLMMPEIDGWDLLQTLLNNPKTADIPIIVCSVLKQKDLALSIGATAYLPKPVSEQSLLSVLENLER
jgi:CheY-like chemotaxis protein